MCYIHICCPITLLPLVISSIMCTLHFTYSTIQAVQLLVFLKLSLRLLSMQKLVYIQAKVPLKNTSFNIIFVISFFIHFTFSLLVIIVNVCNVIRERINNSAHSRRIEKFYGNGKWNEFLTPRSMGHIPHCKQFPRAAFDQLYASINKIFVFHQLKENYNGNFFTLCLAIDRSIDLLFVFITRSVLLTIAKSIRRSKKSATDKNSLLVAASESRSLLH